MPIEKLHIEQFLQLAQHHPVLDVRSPGEFAHAHIPGAYALPLFNDEERKIVGTTYKQESRESAIKVGLDFFGPKMRGMVEEVEKLVDSLQMTDDSKETKNKSKTVLVHCWRGGMRSAGVAWLLDLYGFKVYTLVGGYKFFRRWVLNQFEKQWSFNIVGGYTGSGKTELLKQFADLGERVIDLESLAHHKGSAFGNIGMPAQPSQEMFENRIALKLFHVSSAGDKRGNGHATKNSYASESDTIWMEDESQRIGTVNIPHQLWGLMRKSNVFFLDIPFSERLSHITEEYGQLDLEKMIAAVERIQKRLGGLETKTTISFLREGNIIEAFRILLKYYDKWYLKGLHNRENFEQLCHSVSLATVDAFGNAIHLKQFIQSFSTQKNTIDEPGVR